MPCGSARHDGPAAESLPGSCSTWPRTPQPIRRRPTIPLVNREQELDQLLHAYESTLKERRSISSPFWGRPGSARRGWRRSSVTESPSMRRVRWPPPTLRRRDHVWALAEIVEQAAGERAPGALADRLGGDEQAGTIAERISGHSEPGAELPGPRKRSGPSAGSSKGSRGRGRCRLLRGRALGRADVPRPDRPRCRPRAKHSPFARRVSPGRNCSTAGRPGERTSRMPTRCCSSRSRRARAQS